MISLIYDISKNTLIKCSEINTSFSRQMNSLDTQYEVSIEVSTSIDNYKGRKWVIDWYQSMFANGTYVNASKYKRDIHIEKIDTILHNCFISSYRNEDDLMRITLTADYISIGTEDNNHRNYYIDYYRDLKINELFD